MPNSNQTLPSNISGGITGNEYNSLKYVVKSILAGVRTSLPVEVIAVTNSGGVSPIGYVNIKPLVSQVDGAGNVIEHGTIYNVPYMRIQGGGNAVIIDPEIGDIGIASFADRDISSVKVAKTAAAPGSTRKFDMSDAMYHHSIIGSAPTQYIQFNASGITVHSPGNVTVTAGGNVAVTATGSATVTAASAIVQAATIKLQNTGAALLNLLNSLFATWAANHTHSGVSTGTGTSGPPTSAPASNTQTSVVQAE